MPANQRRFDPWIVVPLAALLAVAGLDVALGSDVTLGAVLIIGPLIASLRLDPRETAAVAAVAFLLSLLLGIENDVFIDATQFSRELAVVLAGAVGVWLSHLRVDRERGALLLTVQGAVSRILNESPTPDGAAPRLLQVIGEALDWQLGAIWQVDSEGQCIRRIASWRAPGFQAAEFESLSDQAAFRRGHGLPGQVWESGTPVSVPEFPEDPTHPRAEAAVEGGLVAAFAFPVRAAERVVGVIEFFATRLREVDPPQLEMFSGLGRQIGLYFERMRAEEERTALLASEHEARLSAERAERHAGETVALLDTLLARAPAGFAFIDTDLRYVRVNDALAVTLGRSADEVVGRSVQEVLPKLPQVADALRSVIDTGEPAIDLEVSGEAPATPGLERHWLASYYPVRGDRGEVMGVGAVVVEITDRKRAEARAQFMSKASAALSASLDDDVTLANIARLTVPDLADWCVVDVLERETTRLRRLAIAHSDPSKERLLWELDRRYPPDVDRDPGGPAAIRTGEPQLYEQVDQSMLEAAARDGDHLRIIRSLGFASAMAVPLVVRGEAIGAVTFASAESGQVFDQEDLALAVELAARAATAVENARLYRERSHIARTLQESLLPPQLPDMPGVELAARYRAAGEENEVGGDFYDVFQTGERTWGVVVGDVLGKGAGAAAMIGLARHTLRAAAMRELDSVSILTILNEALYRESAHESFCTAVYLAIDVSDDSMEVELTCAGHPLPLVLRDSGEVDSVGRPGTLLGAVPRLALEPYRVSLGPGDALVVYTDGVLEARSEGGIFGEVRLRRLLRTLMPTSAREMAEHVAREAIDFQGGIPRDDLAVLVARRRVSDTPPPASADADELEAARATSGEATS